MFVVELSVCVIGYSFMMELFSLEEDDGAQLFITQESNMEVDKGIPSPILGNPNDFKSPLVSIVPKPMCSVMDSKYSDISDENDFEIPASEENCWDNR